MCGQLAGETGQERNTQNIKFCDGGTLASSHVAFIALYLENCDGKRSERNRQAI